MIERFLKINKWKLVKITFEIWLIIWVVLNPEKLGNWIGSLLLGIKNVLGEL